MPTEYTDQFYELDPAYPLPAGSPVSFARLDYTDTDDSGTITSTSVDTINGEAITRVWVGDTVTIDVPGVGPVTYTGVTFYTDTTTYFTPTDGQVLQDGTFVGSTFVTQATQVSVGSFGPACFTPGTPIDVPGGRRRVEDLRPGDLVTTLDSGPMPVRSVLRQTCPATGAAAPVAIAARALGNDAALLVSPQHRFLIADPRACLWFGTGEVLVAARHLVGRDGIRLRPGGRVTYLHLVLDRHEIVLAAGIPTESFDTALLQGRGAGTLLDLEARSAPRTVRRVITRHEARLLVA